MVKFYPLTNVMLTRVVHVSTLHSTCQYYIRQRVKLDYFDYFRGKIVSVVSLWCSVVKGGYLESKIESLPYFLPSFSWFNDHWQEISYEKNKLKVTLCLLFESYGKLILDENLTYMESDFKETISSRKLSGKRAIIN